MGRLGAALRLARLAVPVWLGLAARPGQAEPVIDYGGHTPCAVWLSNPAATQQGLAWLAGAWSGLNLAGGLKNDVFDVGHTLTLAQIAGAVERGCRQNMATIMNEAVLNAYVAARVAGR